MQEIYLDNNATTPMDSLVLEAMKPYYEEFFGNTSSIHSVGQKVRSATEDARSQVAKLIGAKTTEIVFTGSGTESDNTALLGIARRHRSKGDHIITTTIEHSAVLQSTEQLAKEGFRVSYIPVDSQGIVQLNNIAEAIEDSTILISIMHSNNEIGVIQPIQEIATLARQHQIPSHTDAVQTVGKMVVDVEQLGIDLLSLSSHKIHGPKGVGALYIRKGIQLDPLLLGGSHERSRRAGTLNVPGIVGLGKACEIAQQSLEDFDTRVRKLRDHLEKTILQEIPKTVVNGSRNQRAPHLTNISFPNVEGEALLIALDMQGIAVSTGSACSSGTVEPSHVLQALGYRPARCDSAIRFSLSRMNNKKDIDCVLQILPTTIERMRQLSAINRD